MAISVNIFGLQRSFRFPNLFRILANQRTMKNKSIYIVAAAAVLVPLVLFLRTFSASPLPKPDPYTGPLPSATPPKELAVFALVTGVNHRVAAYGCRGGPLFERRDFSMAGNFGETPTGPLAHRYRVWP